MMKVVALILCGLALAAANEHWDSFKQTYEKSYTSNENESYRKSIFEENQKKIDAHNERFRQGLVTFDMAMNQFGDMTKEEITAQMTGHLQVQRKSASVHQRHPKAPMAAEVDWRDQGAVTPVKDQGQCGSCWAFATTGSLEGAHFLKSGELVSLSEQNLMDCSWDYGNMGCDGGVTQWTFDYIKENNGVDTEAFYPYLEKDDTCRFDAGEVGATVTGYKDIRSGSESDLQDAVQNIGPISVAIDASHDSFQFYSSGVYIEHACSPHKLDHAVLAVGYGTEGGQAYWLVKNSWATSWGDKGYIKMAKDMHNMCGIATEACYPTL